MATGRLSALQRIELAALRGNEISMPSVRTSLWGWLSEIEENKGIPPETPAPLTLTDARFAALFDARDTGGVPYAFEKATEFSGEDIQPVFGRCVAGGLGFEPRLTESESAVLPLNYPPPGAAGRRREPARPGSSASRERRLDNARATLCPPRETVCGRCFARGRCGSAQARALPPPIRRMLHPASLEEL